MLVCPATAANNNKPQDCAGRANPPQPQPRLQTQPQRHCATPTHPRFKFKSFETHRNRNRSYSIENSPIQKELAAREVGNVAAFLCSPLASAVTGSLVFVDNGLNCMGLATDSKTLVDKPAA